jgi:TIR domain
MTTVKRGKIRWAEIAFDCALIIGIGQRRNGLWAYPTNDEERGKVYAAPNGLEERERLRGEFGFGSITATWNAFEALSGLFPQFPRSGIRKALAELNTCRGRLGYFGSKTVSYQGDRIIESTRHTALAVLSNLFFSSPHNIDWRSMGETVDWLLQQQIAKLAGGWPFDHSTSDAAEPMSTASCIAALCCYSTFPEAKSSAARSKKVRKAIQNGFAQLISAKKSNLWAPRYSDTYINDNVFVLDMLHQAITRGTLSEVVPGADILLSDISRGICSVGLKNGWPASWGGSIPSLAATVAVLYLNEISPFIEKGLLHRSTVFVSEELLSPTSVQQLAGWNWMMLGRLASRHHVLSNEQAQHVLDLIANFKIAQELKIPSFEVIESFPRATRGAATYILSRGESSSLAQIRGRRAKTSATSELEISNGKLKYKKHVFLSYCREDQHEVAQLRADLIEHGEIVWWDQDIRPGQDFMFEIRRAIKSAYAVVMCFSKDAAARLTSGIYPELRDAIGALREYPPGSTFLIPIRLSECEIPPVEIDSTRTLNQLQRIDFFPPDRRSHNLVELVRALKLTPYHPHGGT